LAAEFRHLKSNWWWLFLLGILLAVGGTAALVFPALTLVTTFAATLVLGLILMIGGVATIITSLWAGRWSGTLVQLLVGILYVVAGWVISERPLVAAVGLAAFIAAFFMVAGLFRIVAALMLRFPYWGWALLNGVVTLMCGLVIYRHFANSALWIVGILIGLEMLFHGWNWIMLALAVRNLPDEAA
jgi:uncharacterized membrane protein HdeD (DUF308 family)